MELKVSYAILISTLINSTTLSTMHPPKYAAVESVIIVLAHPTNRVELQALFAKSRSDGLSSIELERALDLSKTAIDKLAKGPVPMLVTEI